MISPLKVFYKSFNVKGMYSVHKKISVRNEKWQPGEFFELPFLAALPPPLESKGFILSLNVGVKRYLLVQKV